MPIQVAALALLLFAAWQSQNRIVPGIRSAYQDYLPDFSTYFDVNAVSTARIYELIVAHKLPVQRVIVDALKELKASFVKAKTQAKKSARDLGDAMQGDDLSVESMGSVFASLDEGAAAVRDGAFSALSKIHEVLDSRQRRVLADFITRSGGLEDLASSV